MARLSPRQLAWRGRIETLIGAAAPALDLVLWVGDRISRRVERDDDWVPPRPLDSSSPLRRASGGSPEG